MNDNYDDKKIQILAEVVAERAAAMRDWIVSRMDSVVLANLRANIIDERAAAADLLGVIWGAAYTLGKIHGPQDALFYTDMACDFVAAALEAAAAEANGTTTVRQ